MAQTTPAETLALLTRLSQKPGVQSTLVLSKETGAILRTSGLLQSEGTSANLNSALPPSTENDADNLANGDKDGGIHSAEEVARMVYAFVAAAGTLAEGLEKDDEVKLLRVRTKKHELVIVPDSKYILVVIHDTPPA